METPEFTVGVSPHKFLSWAKRLEFGESRAKAEKASVAGKHAAKRGKVRPRRGAGQPKVKLSGIRIGL